MDHVIEADDIVDGEGISEPVTVEEHFNTILGSIGMIGLTYIAVGKLDEAEAVSNVLDFLAFYASEQGIDSEAVRSLKAAVNARRSADPEMTPIERMGGDSSTLALLRGLTGN